jgi:histidinol-phosphatase
VSFQVQVDGSRELEFAVRIAQEAGVIALKYFNEGVEATYKQDDTPVTKADKEVEKLIRQALAETFPGDNILGEEEGETAGNQDEPGRRKWIIDPIDGTYNYARRVPVFSTLLAFEHDGEIKAGVVSAPAMAEIYFAEKGRGAFRNGERIRVSTIEDVSRSQFEFGAPSRILKDGLWEGLGRIVEATYRQRAFGDYMGFAHVFDGRAEAHLELGLKVWDVAPMKVIIEEAGGMYADLEGGRDVYKGSCLVSNGLVHEEIMRLLLGEDEEYL